MPLNPCEFSYQSGRHGIWPRALLIRSGVVHMHLVLSRALLLV